MVSLASKREHRPIILECLVALRAGYHNELFCLQYLTPPPKKTPPCHGIKDFCKALLYFARLKLSFQQSGRLSAVSTVARFFPTRRRLCRPLCCRASRHIARPVALSLCCATAPLQHRTDSSCARHSENTKNPLLATPFLRIVCYWHTKRSVVMSHVGDKQTLRIRQQMHR